MSAHFGRSDRHPAIERICDKRLLRELAYIDGNWCASRTATSFQVTDPATGAILSYVASIDAEQTVEAIAAAARAFQSWKALLPQERAQCLRRWFDLIVAAREDLALIMTLEQGKPLAESRGEIDYAASFVEWYSEEAKRLSVESVAAHLPGAAMSLVREPIGVVGVVTPWNFPSAMMTRKVAAALSAGCTVVAHPSSETPLSALALAELGERAGVPPGVFNVVPGDAETIVERLCADRAVRAMSFTGSTEIGRKIASKCALSMKRLIMELGGHAPFIVFDDTDLNKAVELAVAAKFATSGQDCLAANRVFVQHSIYEPFCTAFAKRIAALRLGRGLDECVEIGPLMHERAVHKIDEHVHDALSHGARCLVGGRRSSLGSRFYDPTLLVDVPDDALIMREETFGPVAAVTSFDTEHEVLSRANNTEYGLVAYVLTENGARQQRMARALDYGMVAVNRVKITGAPIPFGGTKQSGLGREGSRHGMEAFTDLKYVCVQTH